MAAALANLRAELMAAAHSPNVTPRVGGSDAFRGHGVTARSGGLGNYAGTTLADIVGTPHPKALWAKTAIVYWWPLTRPGTVPLVQVPQAVP